MTSPGEALVIHKRYPLSGHRIAVCSAANDWGMMMFRTGKNKDSNNIHFIVNLAGSTYFEDVE